MINIKARLLLQSGFCYVGSGLGHCMVQRQKLLSYFN